MLIDCGKIIAKEHLLSCTVATLENGPGEELGFITVRSGWDVLAKCGF